MKNLLALSVLLFSVSTFAAQAPFSPAVEERFDRIEANSWVTSARILDGTIAAGDIASSAVTEPKLLAATTEGLNAKRIARVTYDVATDLGTVAAHGLGVTLPAKTIITNVYMYIVTQFVDGGSGTVALHCEDADNLFPAADVTGFTVGSMVTGGAYDGTNSGHTAAIGAACEVTATVATAAQTAGKMIIFIEYVVAE